FMALKREADGAAWSQWPDELRRRDARALARAQERLQAGVKLWRGIQFLFFEQWRALRAQAHDLGIEILGDLPIYVAEDSADIWANPQQF
ncbi:4-alpha-glucanotransferase, partial [Acinetobacter baumannii]|nr:4-alpha-glucanotransferase [Acinetobacter baumannii]